MEINLSNSPISRQKIAIREYAACKKTGREFESRPNAPPTWGRFDRSNTAQPTNKIKQKFWIVKFAPFRTSWRDIKKAGQLTLRGVRSHAARKNLTAMRAGDRALFYHSQKEKAIVGILKVIREAYPDPTSSDPKWMTCDFAPIKSFSRPVTLKELRSNLELAELPLLRQLRLSVMPISRNHYELILLLSKESETEVR